MFVPSTDFSVCVSSFKYVVSSEPFMRLTVSPTVASRLVRELFDKKLDACMCVRASYMYNVNGPKIKKNIYRKQEKLCV